MPSETNPKSAAEQALEQRPAFLIGAIANKLVMSNSTVLRREVGVGFTEWRLIVMIALEPGVTAKRIGEVIGIDKAAISRSLKVLDAAGLITPTPETAGRRSQDYVLSAEGRAIYEKMLAWTKETERRLLARLQPEEHRVLVDLLQRVLAQMPEVAGLAPGDR